MWDYLDRVVSLAQWFFEQKILIWFTGDSAYETAYILVVIIGFVGAIFGVVILSLWLWHAVKIFWINCQLKSYRSREEFSEKFDVVIELFEKKGRAKSFRHQWLEFKETLILSGIEKPIKNTKRPFDYFHYGDLRWSPRQFSSWPNVFVGVGLLLTFVGLAAAIGEAAVGVASDDVGEAQEALERVLNAASVKFLTSIAGLAVSIVLGLLIRLAGWGLSGQIRSMCEHIERCTLYEFSEPIEQKQLAQLEEQTEALQSFTDNFAVNLGDSLTEALSPFNEAIKEQLANAESRGSDAVVSMVRELGDRMNAGTGEQMEAIVRSLGEVRNSLGMTIENLSQSLEGGASRMSGEMMKVTSDIREAVTSMTNMMNQNSNHMSEKMGEAGEVLHRSINEGASRVSEQMTQAGEVLHRSINESASRASEQMTQAGQTLHRSMNEGAGQVSEQMTQAGESFGRKLTEAASSIGGELGEVTRTMAGAADRFNTGVSTLDEKLRVHADMLDGKIREVQKTLPGVASAAQALREASEPIALTANRFERASEALQGVSSDFEGVKTHFQSMANTMTEAHEKTSKSWEQYRSRFEGVDEDLERIFKQYGDHIQTSQDQMRTFVTELDRNFARAGESLQGVTENLSGVFEELSEEIQGEKEALQGLKTILEELTREVRRGRDNV